MFAETSDAQRCMDRKTAGTTMLKRKTTLGMIASFIAILMIAVVACGGDVEEPATAIPAPSVDAYASDDPVEGDEQKLESAEARANVNSEEQRVASAKAVHPAIEPEPGSDEAAIIESYEEIVRAIRTRDYAAYVEACAPTSRRLSIEQTEFVFRSIWDEFLDVAGMTQREVTIRLFDDGTALTEAVMYEYDDLFLERLSYGFTKIDGEWYATTNCQA
jgi:hypothetical protein